MVVGRCEEREKKKGLTHDQLDRLTAGSERRQRTRHAAIRNILYWVSVPHRLEDGARQREEEEHSYDNRLRRENDEAFSRGVQAMLQYFSSRSWAERPTLLTLSLVLQAERCYTLDMETEPGTYPAESDEKDLADYRANLTDGTKLTPVSCIRAVHFPRESCPTHGEQNGISLPAQIQILSACSGSNALTDIKLDGAYCTGGQAQHRAQKRDEMATFLPLLPRSMRKLCVEWQDEVSPRVYIAEPQPRSRVDVPFDALSRALHTTSSQLRELHLSELEITSDLFHLRKCDEHASDSFFWPSLEVLSLTLLPMATPDGRPLIYDHPSAATQDTNSVAFGLSIVSGFFDNLYASAGRAARRMPKLQRFFLSFEQDDTHQLGLTTKGHGRVLQFTSLYGYSPCEEVLRAWQIPEGNLIRRYEMLEAEYQSWPPPCIHGPVW